MKTQVILIELTTTKQIQQFLPVILATNLAMTKATVVFGDVRMTHFTCVSGAHWLLGVLYFIGIENIFGLIYDSFHMVRSTILHRN